MSPSLLTTRWFNAYVIWLCSYTQGANLECKCGVGVVIERAPARIKPPSGRNKKLFLGSHPNPQCHKSPRGTAKQACKHNTHPHPPTVSRAFKPPFTDIFWPGSAHVNSRGKTVTYFQNSSRSKSGPQVETELAQRYDLTHDRSRTHSHLRELLEAI